MTDVADRKWKCSKCDVALAPARTEFTYLERTFSHEVLRCPKCRSVFIPRELAEGKMAEVERMLEDK